jgi:hypothetical protein
LAGGLPLVDIDGGRHFVALLALWGRCVLSDPVRS